MPVTLTEYPAEAASIPITTSVSRWTQSPETQLICWLAKQVPGDVLEIGCNNGLTTRELGLTKPNDRVFGMDYVGIGNTMVPEQRYEKPWHEFGKWCTDIPNVTLLNMDSTQLNYAATCPGVRTVFIDGDHSYDQTASDIDVWRPKVAPGGILCGHDCEARAEDHDKDFLWENRNCDVVPAGGNFPVIHAGVVLAVGEKFGGQARLWSESIATLADGSTGRSSIWDFTV